MYTNCPCIHACMHTYIHAYMHACMHACIHTYIHAYLPTYLPTYIHAYIHSYIFLYTNLNVVHTRTKTNKKCSDFLHTYLHTYIFLYTKCLYHLRAIKATYCKLPLPRFNQSENYVSPLFFLCQKTTKTFTWPSAGQGTPTVTSILLHNNGGLY